MLTPQQEQHYRQAEQAFAAGDARQALAMLQALEAQCPGEERVARAMQLCMQRLSALDPLGMEPQARPRNPKAASLRDYLPEPKHVALILALVLFACLGFAMNQQAARDAQLQMSIEQNLLELPPPPPGAVAIMVAQYFTTGCFALLVATFIALYLLDEMPGTDFAAAMPGVVTAALYSIPFIAVPLVGWVALAAMVKRKTGCSAGALAKAVALYAATLLVLGAGLNVAIAQLLMGMDALMPA